MLIRFKITNFLSFKGTVEFNMLTGSFKTHKHHVYKAGKVDVVKAAAIYGANAAGKSNLIKAIASFQNIVANGSVPSIPQNNIFRLDPENEHKPITFEIEFFLKSKTYVYGFSVGNIFVFDEWLYESGVGIKDKLIFKRFFDNNKLKIEFPKFAKSPKGKLLIELMEENLLLENQLFLNKKNELKVPELEDIHFYITNNIRIIYPHSLYVGMIKKFSSSEQFKNYTNQLLLSFNTGIDFIDTEAMDMDKYFNLIGEFQRKQLSDRLKEGESIELRNEFGHVLLTKEDGKDVVKKLVSYHNDCTGKKVKFDLNMESDGTLRLLDYIPAFELILKEDYSFFIDEIEHSLHPTILKMLIKKFMDEKNTKGQIIFTTHESNLLDLNIFRQDEIWFVEKDQAGASNAYPLSDFKPRYDLDISKGYLNGRFGAIPFLANLKELNWNRDEN